MEGADDCYDEDISEIRRFNNFCSKCAAQWDPCIFPASGSASRAEAAICAVELPLHDQEFSPAFYEGTSVNLTTAFQVAWGLVLKCYTGNDRVSFGYGECTRDAEGNPVDDFLTCTRHMELREDQRILQIAESLEQEVCGNCRRTHPVTKDYERLGSREVRQANTAILFQRPSRGALQQIDPSAQTLLRSGNVRAHVSSI